MKKNETPSVIARERKQYDTPKIEKLEVKLEYSIAQASVEGNMKESKDVDSQTVDIGW